MRYEYYKRHGKTLRVTTCACCRIDDYRDAWEWRGKGPVRKHIGVTDADLRENYVLITEREALKRVGTCNED